MSFRLVILIIISYIYIGCSKTTIVLLDNGKTENAIIVTTDGGSRRLDKTGDFIELTKKDKAPNKTGNLSSKEIKSRFDEVLLSAPNKPKTYILYFNSNSVKLTQESEKFLLEAIASMKKRSPCVVDIIGHTDTVGSKSKNLLISLKRAKYIESIINDKGIDVISLTAKGYGEETLFVDTPDNTAELKNRNVEIFIK
jgi:outer membrane protein OmpA-like peptidoglycan-associated protein